jgi:hypothetical protein
VTDKESGKFTLGIVVGLIVIGIVTIAFHELGHYVAAWSLGVPTQEIQIHFYPGYGPGVNVPESSLDVNQLRIFHYAGGLSAGVITLFFYGYLVWRYYRNTSTFIYGVSTFTVLWITLQFTMGYYEGGNFEAYVRYSWIKPWLFILLSGWAFHFILFWACKKLSRRKLQNIDN